MVEKEIFLDIACFFRGKNKNDVTKILDSCGFHAIIGIDVLVKKSLVTLSNNKLMMHDLIQELGWYIVRQKSPKEPGQCSRLWLQEDLTRVLMENTVRDLIEKHDHSELIYLTKLILHNFVSLLTLCCCYLLVLIREQKK